MCFRISLSERLANARSSVQKPFYLNITARNRSSAGDARTLTHSTGGIVGLNRGFARYKKGNHRRNIYVYQAPNLPELPKQAGGKGGAKVGSPELARLREIQQFGNRNASQVNNALKPC